MLTARDPDPEAMTALTTRSNWVFLTRRSLPDDPEARQLEKKGRWWLVLSYVLCPCHLPVTLSLLAVAFGGTVLGSFVVGNGVWVAGVLTALYLMVLWRAFNRLRAAKALVAAGEVLVCGPEACEVKPLNDDLTASDAAALRARLRRPAGGL